MSAVTKLFASLGRRLGPTKGLIGPQGAPLVDTVSQYIGLEEHKLRTRDDRNLRSPFALSHRAPTIVKPDILPISASHNDTDPEMALLGEGVPDTELDGADNHTFKTAPVFTGDAYNALGPDCLPQKALYGRLLQQDNGEQGGNITTPKLYINTNTPFSALICGVQASRVITRYDNVINPPPGLREKPLYFSALGKCVDQRPEDRHAARASKCNSVSTT